ncbi:hypothetical protein ACIQVE_21375 [Pseudomonas sp. NPDC098747]|uniref:structural cement protein Gp24 n=1 Tax=Pseudomonas sp. NPDC098747 TaxID=3364487 RepID=UPI00383A3936
MPFQQKVGTGLVEGLPGDPASANPFSTIVKQAKDACAPGLFLWGSANGKTFSPLGAGKPDAYCMRDQTGVFGGFLKEAGNIIPLGFNATGVIDGDWYAVSKTTASVKQKVFASNLNGTISTGAAGSSIADHTETDFTVTKVAGTGAAGSAIVISKH